MNASVEDSVETIELRFGKILVEKEAITEQDLEYALRVQARMEEKSSFGEVLVGLKLMTHSELKHFLREYKKMIPIGELLLENGILTRTQLSLALEAQSENKDKRIGEILIEKDFITERDLLMALCEQKEIPFIEPNLAMLDESILKRISTNYLVNKCLIPLTNEDGKILVISNDIFDRHVRSELESTLGCPVSLALAPKAQIETVLRDYIKEKSEGGNIISQADADKRIVELVDFFLCEAIGLGASDLHFEPISNRLRLRYRIDGVLVYQTDLPKEMESRLISRIKILSNIDIAERRRHQDGRFHYLYKGEEIDMRVSTYVTVHGENLVMRVLNKHKGLLDLEELGMPPLLLDNYKDFVLQAPAGVVVITGPTGSGKTTTLYSSIDSVNEIGVKIITAEDPVEYQIDGIMQCSINNKIGLTFNDTLKAIVRQDPDIIVLGEIRDRVTAETAIQAALTGHKVFTTFHTEDSVGGLLRLMNMEIETFLISSTVICMVAQRLIRRICKHCIQEAPPSIKALHLLNVDPADLKGMSFYMGRGCEHCHYTGYKGRTAIYELLVLNEKVKDAILEQKTSDYIRRISIEDSGLVTMQECGIAKTAQGITTFDEVVNKAPFSMRPRPIREIFNLLGDELEV